MGTTRWGHRGWDSGSGGLQQLAGPVFRFQPLVLATAPAFDRFPNRFRFERGDRSDCECRRKVGGEIDLVPPAFRLSGCGDRLSRNSDQGFLGELWGRR